MATAPSAASAAKWRQGVPAVNSTASTMAM